jgi:4'-phosphopantetheinyl transferase
MTAHGCERGEQPGTEGEVVRWTSPAGDGECSVVWLPVDRLDAAVASTEVTASERERAAAYTRRRDRLLSLGSAWLTRRLVANLLDIAPLATPIARDCARCGGQHGRPVVGAATRDGATVHVSATHSGGLIGVALSTSGPVGLDVEDLRGRGPDAWPMVWRVLGHPCLPGRLASRPAETRAAATAWVRTEAVLKSTGQGLAVGARSIGIATDPEPRVSQWPWGNPAGQVSLFDLEHRERYVAALAVIHDCSTDFAMLSTKESA